MNGWVIYNGHLSGPKFIDFAQWIQKSARNQNIHIEIIKNNHLLASLGSDGTSLVQMDKIKQPDFVVFGDKDIPLARQLEALNIPVFNSSQAIESSDNKITTYQLLAQQKLPIPRTIVGPKIFPGVGEIDVEGLVPIENQLDYPMVIKEAYGSFGEQVYLVQTRQELFRKLEEIKERPFVIQQFISTSYGRDIRLNVVGDKVVASMLRKARNDFRANISAGGTMESYQPSEQEIALAIAATKAVGADFAGVDLLFGENDQPIICEVNSNAHIRNIFECTGINVADHMIRYIANKLKGSGRL